MRDQQLSLRLYRSLLRLYPAGFRDNYAAPLERQFRDELRKGSDVSQAIYGAGFSSPSRVYERAGDDLGMTPAQYRRGAPEETVRVALGRSPFGIVGVGRTDAGICSIRLGDSPDDVLSAITSELPNA